MNEMRKKRNLVLYLTFFLFIAPLHLFAQQVTVKGRVIEQETGEPLPGVSIVVENTPRGVSTDIDGTFEIKVNTTDKLTFSFLGMTSQTVAVGDKTFIEVALLPATSELEEVTIVAFGRQKKESVIGAITTVSPGDLKVPSSNLTTALAGNVAGVIALRSSRGKRRDSRDNEAGTGRVRQNIRPLGDLHLGSHAKH